MKHTSFKSILAMAALAIGLSACGGGGGDDAAPAPNPGPQPTQPQQPAISGKAIDGYLVGARVCVDLNSNGGCDGNEPTTHTDDTGSYALPFDGDLTGKKLVVMVDQNTKDLSRPGHVFPASFALTAAIDGQSGQNVTPLTTMHQALMEHGTSADDATKAVVSFVGGAVNLKDDYIANGDSTAQAFAMQVVDKVAQFAKNGEANADTVRGLMNAIVLKGGVENVTQEDVDTLAAKPALATDVDAKTALTTEVYAYNGPYYLQDSGEVFTRQRFVQVGEQVHQGLEAFVNGAWTTVEPNKLTAHTGHYQLRTDGTWSRLLNEADLYAPLSIQAISGNAMQLTDPNTGALVKLEFRRNNVGNKSFLEVMSGWMEDDQVRLALKGAFASEAQGLVGIQTRTNDLVQIDLWNCGTDPLLYVTQDGVTHCNWVGNRDTVYTSIDQVLGTEFTWGMLRVTLNADGTAVAKNSSGLVVLTAPKFTWSRYAGNSNVIVFNLKKEDVGHLPVANYDQIIAGGKAAIALNGGRIQAASLMPGNVAQSTLAFTPGLFDPLFDAIKNVQLY